MSSRKRKRAEMEAADDSTAHLHTSSSDATAGDDDDSSHPPKRPKIQPPSIPPTDADDVILPDATESESESESEAEADFDADIDDDDFDDEGLDALDPDPATPSTPITPATPTLSSLHFDSYERRFVGRRPLTWYRDGSGPRHTPSVIDNSHSPLIFQQTEMDYTVLPARRFSEFRYAGPQAAETETSSSSSCVVSKCAVMRFYGCTDQGESVVLRVWGFMPYFYAEPPPNFDLSPRSIDQFRLYLIRVLRQSGSISSSNMKEGTQLIECIQVVEKVSMWMHKHENGGKRPYLKIITGLPSYVVRIRSLLSKGLDIPGIGMRRMRTYESNVLFVLRCCIDAGIVGCNWLEVPVGKYSVCQWGRKERTSRCAIECDCSREDLISHLPTEEYSKIAPVRILSFDIECLGYLDAPSAIVKKRKRKAKVHFPSAKRPECAVIQIANTVTVQGEDAPRIQNVFLLGTSAPISGCDVHSFRTERDLLLAWADFVRATDPDIITGYNIINFDFPYLLDRATHLRIEEFRFMGRIRNMKVSCRRSRFASKQMGARETREITMRGRVLLDVLDVVRREYKLSSYTLNNVSSIYLGQQKEDVHYSIIHELHAKDAETRKRLAMYCLKDALLPQRLIDKLMIIYNTFEMARVTGISLTMILRRGQQIKVVSQLLREAGKRDLVMPYVAIRGAQSGEKRFTGATVLEPISGFYQKYPITTLDFASLYPSIMIAHNLCYTTLISERDVQSYRPEDLTHTPAGNVFVKANVSRGLLPVILRSLLDARSKAKQDLKHAHDPIEKAVLNGRQLALKISANSVYGFTGAAQGQLPCLAISRSVTAFGREMIDRTKQWVEDTYSIRNGFRWNSQVIYGDTDSVMIKFGTQDLAEAMDLGKQAAKQVSQIFISPIRLEFEKSYQPYLLLTKKRYAGLLYTQPDHYDKIDTKGIETVRRDTCAMVRNVLKTCLYLILVKQSLSAAKDYVKSTMSCLLKNKLDIAMLIITKTLSLKTYKARQAHSELAVRLRKRDPATAPKQGDRVMFVYVQKGRGSKEYEKSEDPNFVLQNSLPLDTGYYLQNKLRPVLRRLFEKILTTREMNELLQGDHTRKIVIPTPSSGGIMRFARKKVSCLQCKRAVKGNDPVCGECLSDEASVYEKILNQRNYYEELFRKAWTHCQRCQESLHSEVLCSNDDCPIFYMRAQIRNELIKTQATLERFQDLDW